MVMENWSVQAARTTLFFLACVLACTSGAQESATTPGKTFAWESQNMHFYDSARFGDDTIKAQLEDALIAGLEAKGLRFVPSIESADLELSYVAVLENAATAQEVAAFFQANPEIAGDAGAADRFEEGMLYAKLVDRRSRAKAWENTYRGFVALDIPEAPRKERFEELTVEFFADYPR